ncbi:nucleolar protein 6-like [Physella acuta]|uniref:nucleolar protein 6-like n=1 Tax=Physella acuta TaxID=109671 RepID=UPI0027DAC98C|nr:nucleolar protein 6-like [Physella acuta]
MKRKLSESEDERSLNVDKEGGNNKLTDAISKEHKKAKLKAHDFSTQEIARLKETESLFHSSLFRLQVSELLKEISTKQKLKSSIEECVSALIKTLKNLPAGKEHKITERHWLETKAIQVPLVEKPFHVKGNFQFLPPAEVRETGSVVLDTLIKPDVQVDLVLRMPKACFHVKDYLNQRYTRKRALYLCAVANHLCKKKRIEDLKFSYLMGNPHKPVLIILYKGKDDSQHVKFRLHAEPDNDIFKLARFHVSKNNVRPKWFYEKGETVEEDAEGLPATSYYNSSILHDLTSAVNDQFIEKMLKGSEGIQQGLMLLKIWLRQRELLGGDGAFSGYLMSAFVVNILLLKKINKLMNGYQIFRTTLLYLSKADWILEPPSLFEGKTEKCQPSIDEFRSESGCVFVDRTGYFNLAYMLSASIFSRVKAEAKISLSALDQHQQGCFDALFMTPVSFARKFDHIFHVSVTPSLLVTASKNIEGLSQRQVDLGGHISMALSLHILSLLSKSLEKRVLLVQAKTNPCVEWEISEQPLSYDNVKSLTFGLVLDVSGAFNILDRGPPADVAEAKEFRDFWGEKAEMRRFKDGTIHEAVLWTSSSNQCDRRLVCKSIVQHVLNRHCGIPHSDIHYMEGKLDQMLHLNLISKNADQHYGTGEEQSLAIHHSFDQLNRAIRSLTTIPLAIHSVQGVHPVFRHADVFPALPAPKVTIETEVVLNHVVPKEGKALPQFVPAMEVICLLEGSGKWPEDLEAISCMKSLFHIKIGNELKEKHNISVSVRKSHVDVLMNGFVFRLKVANTRELAVLRTLKTEDGMIKFKDTDESIALEREIVALPHLTSLLHGIQQDHPAYSATVRLCKRWIASQMVWDFVPEEVIELLVAYTFICPQPYSSPGSPCTGLMRFLHLLSTFNWKADPLLINLNKEFTEEDFSKIPKEFTKNRATLPSMCLSTPHDKQGTKWTRPNPTEPFLQRLIILARESLKILEAQVISEWATSDFKVIFRPPLQHFDHLIRLIKKTNVLHYQNVDSKTDVTARKWVEKPGSQPLPVVNFNPARMFLQDLHSVFGEIAMFFYDPYGGDVIGMVWKRQALETKEFKTSHFTYRKPKVDEKEVISLELEKDCILDDIRVMGGGIVEGIISKNN